MNKSFAFVQNLRIPNEYAIGLYIVKACEAAVALRYKTYLLLPNRTQPKHFPTNNLWQYYKVRENLFTLVKFNVLEFNSLPSFIEFFYCHLRYQVIVWSTFLQSLYFLQNKKIEIVETLDREIILLLRFCFWYRPIVIYDVHMDAKTWYEKILENLTLMRIDVFQVNCQYFQDYFISKGIDQKKILVIPNGYDPNQYKIQTTKSELISEFQLPKNRIILGFIGRFDTGGYEKGVDDMIRVVAELKKEIPITVFAIGGPDKYVSKYRELAKELNLSEEECIIHSQVEPEEVARYIATFDIACMLYPNVAHFYDKMSPMKLIEYMAGKRIIIGTNLPSITQVLTPERGYVVEPGNILQLKNNILHIINNPDEANKKAENAYKYAQKLSWVERQRQILQTI